MLGDPSVEEPLAAYLDASDLYNEAVEELSELAGKANIKISRSPRA